jgi:uncharacterized protein YceK
MKKIIAVIATLLMFAGCGSATEDTAGDNTGGGAASSKTPASKSDTSDKGTTAEFKVTTTGKANVMWGTTSGTSQKEIGKGNWSQKVTLKSFDGATLIVTNGDFMKSVKVTCEILIDGVSKSKNSAEGQSASASCNTSSIG